MKRHHTLLFSLLFWPLFALAHGPTPQKAKAEVVIDATPEAVWQVLEDFAGIASWHPDIEASTGDGVHASGGIRTLTFKGGEVLTDELDYYNAEQRQYNYRLKETNFKALPVSSYSVKLTVVAEGAGSKASFKARFYRADTGNTPPEQLNDAAAVSAMTAYLQHGLDGLKQAVADNR